MKKRKVIILILTIGIAGAIIATVGALSGWFGGSSAVPSDTFTRGLVGYWSFDEGSGQYAYDASEYSNDGTLGTSTTADAADPSWTTGKEGGALEFDGSDDYVNCGDNSSLEITSAITLEAWINPDDITNEYIVSKRYAWDSVNGYAMFISGGNLYFEYGNGTSYAQSGKEVPLTTASWQHVVTTLSGDTVSFYLNGTSYGTTNTGISGIGIAAEDLALGAYWEGWDPYNPFDGIIDEVRVYNRALSAAEIRYHYNRGGPVAYWSFNEGNGTTTYDATDNNNDGTLGDGTCSPGTSTCPSWTTGKHGTALNFDGTDDYVEVPTSTSSGLDITNAITLETWAKKVLLSTTTKLFEDDFETNDFSKWDGKLESDGTIATTSLYKHRGDHAMRFQVTGANGYAEIYEDLPGSGQTTVYARFYIYFPSDWSFGSGNDIGILTLADDAAWNDRLWLTVHKETDPRLEWSYFESDQTSHHGNDGNVNFSKGVWHYIEVKLVVATSTGAVTIWVDDSKVVDSTGLDTGDTDAGVIYSGCVWAEEAHDFIYVDDFVYDDSYIGPETKTTISKGEDAYSLKMSPDGSTLYGYISDNEISASVSTPLEWHHYALTYDGSYQRLYIDGRLVNSTSLTGSITTNSTNIKIGDKFSGPIDDVRIYNYARTPDEIRLDYNAGLAAKLGGSPDPIFKSNLLPLWKYRKKIAIDKNKIDEDLTDFPVLVKLTSSNFDFSKAKNNGYDIRFTDADDTQLLAYERERHSTSTQQAEYWVRIPDISSTGDTSFYMYYNNSNASDGEDTENVWDGNFVMVQHMDDETTSTTTDSTSHNNDGTKNAANEPIEVDAKIGKGQDGDGYDDHINCGTDSSFDDIRHVSFWFNSEASSNQEGLMSYHAANTDRWVILGYHSCCNSPNVFVGSEDSFIIEANSSHAGDETWHRLDLEWDGSTTTMYIDGDAQTQTSSINPFADGGGGILYLGTYRYDEWIDNAFEGKYDEYRVSTTNRGAAWIKASFYSGNDGLLTFGDEETNTMPVGHWKFDEGGGSIAFDATDNNNDGTLNLGTQGNTATSAAWVTGKYGTAVKFDGSDDYVVVADDDSLDMTENLTVSAWAKFSNVDGPEQGIVGKCEDYASFSLRLNHLNIGDKKVGIKLENGEFDNYLIESTTLVENNKWYHIVGVKEGSSYLKLYLNGGLENSMTNVSMAENDFNLFIGGDPKGTAPGELDYPFNGIIDDVRIYNYARTDEQIKMDYNAGLAAHFGPQTDCDIDPGACMTKGLVGYWNFEEGSGQTAYDMSDYSNDGRLGTTTATETSDPSWTTGKEGGALYFDGSDDYVEASTSVIIPNEDPKSICAWFNVDTWKNWGRLFMWFDGTNIAIVALGDNGEIGGTLKANSDNRPLTGAIFSVNEWHHVCLTFDGNTTTTYVYFDGVNQPVSDAGGWGVNDYGVFIGARVGYTYFFNGIIDEVRVYNRALSPEEVRYHYNRGGPVGHWKLDEGEGSTASDSTENDNDGTLKLGTQGNTATSAAWVTGKYGAALRFDGEDDYVQIEDDSTLRMTTALTMEAWMKIPSGVTGNRAVMGGQGDANWSQGYDLYYEATENVLRMRLGYGDGSQEGYLYNYYVTSSVDLEDNAWHHVAGTFDEPYASLYVDGVQVARGINNNGVTHSYDPVNIGARGISPSWEYNYFRGLIDDARIYNYARTAEQIRLDYNAGLGIHFK